MPHVVSWNDNPDPEQVVTSLVAVCGPDPWVGAVGPDRAELAAQSKLGVGLEAVGDVWMQGRMFGSHGECYWRIEGDRSLIVLVADEARADLPEDGSVDPSGLEWVPFRRSSRILWDSDDRQLPRGIRAPSGAQIRTIEYHDAAGRPVWVRYLDLEE